MSAEINRIYQGRTVKVEIKDNAGKWNDTGVSYSTILLHHHTLFQDAVNYYLLALAAMANDPDSLAGKMKQRICDSAWNDFSKNGELRSGMHRSIERSLAMPEGSLHGTDGFEVALKRVLDGNDVNPDILQLAIELIQSKCKGDIQQPGATYIRRLTSKEYNSSWDYDVSALNRASGKQKIIKTLFNEDCSPRNVSDEELRILVSQIQLSDFDIKVHAGFWEGKEASDLVIESADFFLKPNNKAGEKIISLLENDITISHRLKEIGASAKKLTKLRFEKNNKVDPNRKNIAILFLAAPCRETVRLVQTFFGKNEIKDAFKQGDSISASEYLRFGDDPVKLARGVRGYVFKPFTALNIWQDKTDWAAFDKEAFKEALKTLNQFGVKGAEREQELAEVREKIAWMDGKGAKPAVSSEDEEDETSSVLPVLNGDPRWEALRQIQQDIGTENDFTDGEPIEYGLAKRTIRGFRDIREQWQKFLTARNAESEDCKNFTQKRMVDYLHQYQTENKYSMGSADLFHKLAEPQNWMIWRKDFEGRKEFQSDDIISDAVRYFELKEEELRLEQPILFTPADPQYSRRLCDLSAISGGKQNTTYGHDAGLSLKARIAFKDGGKWASSSIRITYTAPRLLRDGLKNINGTAGVGSYYLPPLAAGLMETPVKIDFQKAAIQLMPDWDRNNKLRILLNFAVSIDVKDLQQTGAKRFQKQFFGTRDKNIFLHWPETDKTRKADWYMSGKPFDILSVDLGQRTAGAAAILHVSTEELLPKYSRFIGNDGSRNWYALRKYAELLRLPGEDCKCWRNGKFEVETFGRKGRKSTHDEDAKALELCRKLGESEELLSGAVSYPEQNDKLLIAVRRAIGRLRKLNRWIRFWNLDDAGKTKALMEMADSGFVSSPFSLEDLMEQEKTLREAMPALLLEITSRVLPLRGRHWCWTVHPESAKIRQKNPSFLLCQSEKGTASDHVWIRGQRGLSFARLEQLEELRKNWLSLNRLLMLPVGAKALTPREMRNQPIPDPCPDILNRLNEMKEQRVNQTAHLILALALGLRLKKHSTTSEERNFSSIHGEYEKIPGRSPVSFIVLENLSRYLSGQGRAPSENSKLMKWMHRAVQKKIVELCKPFGIHVLEVNAAYSSRFSSVSCVPGFRAEEVTLKDRDSYYWHRFLSAQKDGRESPETADCRKIFEVLEEFSRIHPEIKTFSLPMPRPGGEVFIPADWHNEPLMQADINAAVNIGLRGIASPFCYDVFPKIRAKKDSAADWLAIGTSKHDEIRFGSKGRKIKMLKDLSSDIPEEKASDLKGGHPSNFFYDIAHIVRFDSACFTDDESIRLASGKALWKEVNDRSWRICQQIAEYRMEKMKK